MTGCLVETGQPVEIRLIHLHCVVTTVVNEDLDGGFARGAVSESGFLIRRLVGVLAIPFLTVVIVENVVRSQFKCLLSGQAYSTAKGVSEASGTLG